MHRSAGSAAPQLMLLHCNNATERLQSCFCSWTSGNSYWKALVRSGVPQENHHRNHQEVTLHHSDIFSRGVLPLTSYFEVQNAFCDMGLGHIHVICPWMVVLRVPGLHLQNSEWRHPASFPPKRRRHRHAATCFALCHCRV